MISLYWYSTEENEERAFGLCMKKAGNTVLFLLSKVELAYLPVVFPA